MEYTSSPDNTVISLPGEEIVDAAGNVGAIQDGQVSVNGVIDPTTARVIEMAYENGAVWQKNADDLWWSKISPDADWLPTNGTNDDPMPDQQASANDSVLLGKPSGVIADGQVLVSGAADPTTARAVELVYSGGQIWQRNADDLWWGEEQSVGWMEPAERHLGGAHARRLGRSERCHALVERPAAG